MANYTTTITNEGAALLASVIANQGTLTFNEFRFSENNYTGQESTLTEGTFLGVFITASAAASVIDSTTIKASAQFDNSTITGNHDLYSIGIIGTDGNTTALIAVCTTTDPDVIREPLTGTSTYAFNVNLTVSDTSQITVVGTTAAVIYDIDVVDNLISPATNKPLSANQGRVLNEKVESLTNPNLLDNPWFTINQRGNASFSSAGYTVDRWAKEASGGGTLTLTSDGIQFPASQSGGNLYQLFESGKFLNKKITVTLKYSDGSFAVGTLTYTTPATTVINDGKMKVYLYDDTILLQHNTTDATARTIRAVKLELGSISTLANDVEPNYTAELLKCQRYFYRVNQEVATAMFAIVMGMSATVALSPFRTPVPMRATPNISFGGTFNLVNASDTNVVATMTLSAYTGDLGTLSIGSSNLTPSNVYILTCGQPNSYIDFNSEL